MHLGQVVTIKPILYPMKSGGEGPFPQLTCDIMCAGSYNMYVDIMLSKKELCMLIYRKELCLLVF